MDGFGKRSVLGSLEHSGEWARRGGWRPVVVDLSISLRSLGAPCEAVVSQGWL